MAGTHVELQSFERGAWRVNCVFVGPTGVAKDALAGSRFLYPGKRWRLMEVTYSSQYKHWNVQRRHGTEWYTQATCAERSEAFGLRERMREVSEPDTLRVMKFTKRTIRKRKVT